MTFMATSTSCAPAHPWRPTSLHMRRRGPPHRCSQHLTSVLQSHRFNTCLLREPVRGRWYKGSKKLLVEIKSAGGKKASLLLAESLISDAVSRCNVLDYVLESHFKGVKYWRFSPRLGQPPTQSIGSWRPGNESQIYLTQCTFIKIQRQYNCLYIYSAINQKESNTVEFFMGQLSRHSLLPLFSSSSARIGLVISDYIITHCG